MSDALEKKLEDFEWKNRSFSRHRVQLKAALLQAASKEESKTSWLHRGWVNIMYMSLPKKVLGGGLVVMVAAVLGVIGSGKLPAVAERTKLYLGKSYTDLSTSKEKKVVADTYWQQLQYYVELSKKAPDLKLVGQETVMIVPFNAQGSATADKQEIELSMWQFTVPDKSDERDTAYARIGYDKQGSPQYFTAWSVARNSSVPTYEKEWYKKRLQDYSAYAEKASDLKIVPYSHSEEHYLTDEEVKEQSGPQLNEIGNLEYIPKEMAAANRKWTNYIFKDSEGTEDSISSGMFATSTIEDIIGGKIVSFSLPNGRKIKLVVGKSGKPYEYSSGGSTAFGRALKKLNDALFERSIDFSKYFSSTDQSDAEHIIAIYMPASLVPGGVNELFKDPDFLSGNPAKDPAARFKPNQLPNDKRNILVDAFGLPQDLLLQLKKEIPDMAIIKINPPQI